MEDKDGSQHLCVCVQVCVCVCERERERERDREREMGKEVGMDESTAKWSSLTGSVSICSKLILRSRC